jgi:hypothetical protein
MLRRYVPARWIVNNQSAALLTMHNATRPALVAAPPRAAWFASRHRRNCRLTGTPPISLQGKCGIARRSTSILPSPSAKVMIVEIPQLIRCFFSKKRESFSVVRALPG